jgi:ABC-type uncharacterized transport system substrate-binding protein
MRRATLGILFLAVTLAPAGPGGTSGVWAQEALYATVTGRVTDGQGRPVAGARVVAWCDGGGSRRATTRADGVYRFQALWPLAHYTLTVDATGYRPVTYDGLRLERGRRRVMDFRLKRPGEREVVALVSRDPYPYQDLIRGFRRGVDLPVRVIDLDDDPDPAETVRRCGAERPNLVLGAGLRAGRLIRREIRDVPSILTLISDPRRYDLETSTTCFVANNPAPDALVRRVTALLPAARVVGLVYDSELSTLLARDVREAAARAGLRVELRPCYSPGRLQEALDTLRGRIDALLVLYDPVTSTPEALDLITGWALRQRVPLAAPGSEWVRRGALLSYGGTLEGVGAEAARVAAAIVFQGREPADFRLRAPEQEISAVNRVTALALGVTIPDDVGTYLPF